MTISGIGSLAAGEVLPVNPTRGQIFFKTDGVSGYYACTSSGEWAYIDMAVPLPRTEGYCAFCHRRSNRITGNCEGCGASL